MIITNVARGVALDVYMPLVSASSDDWKGTPTLAAGDFQISKDGGSFSNLATLPSETASGSKLVKFPLSSTEMDAGFIVVRCVDQTATKEWKDTGFVVVPEWRPFLLGTINDASATTTQATLSSAFPASTDGCKNMSIVGLSGANKGLSRQITAYTSGRVATFDAFPTAWSNGDQVAVIGTVK